MRIGLTIVILLAIANEGSAHKCYVCKPVRMRYIDTHEMRKVFPSISLTSIPYCHEYTKSKREDFMRECPADSAGCLTKFEAGSLLRTCARVGIEDCKEINGVNYCYCKGQLCNTPDRKLAEPKNIEVPPAQMETKSLPSTGHEINDWDQEGSGGEHFDVYSTSFGDDEDDDGLYPVGDVDVTEPPLMIQNGIEEPKQEDIVSHEERPREDEDIEFEETNSVEVGSRSRHEPTLHTSGGSRTFYCSSRSSYFCSVSFSILFVISLHRHWTG